MTAAKLNKREVDSAVKSLVSKLGVHNLAKRLKVSSSAIYFWLGRGVRKSRPRPAIAKRLLALRDRLATVRKEA